MTWDKKLVISFFFSLCIVLQKVNASPKLTYRYQCDDNSTEQVTSEFLTARYNLRDSSTLVNNNFLGHVQINSVELFVIMSTVDLDPYKYSSVFLKSILEVDSFQSCLYNCKRDSSCHFLFFHRNKTECRLFEGIAFPLPKYDKISNISHFFVGLEEEVKLLKPDDDAYQYAQKICLSRSGKGCEIPSWMFDGWSATNISGNVMFSNDSQHVWKWIGQILNQICAHKCFWSDNSFNCR